MSTVIPLGHHFLWPGLLHLSHLLVISLFFSTLQLEWSFQHAGLIMSLICLKYFNGFLVLSVESLKSLNYGAYWALNDPALTFLSSFISDQTSPFSFCSRQPQRSFFSFLILPCFLLLLVFLKAIQDESRAWERGSRWESLGVVTELKEDRTG